ncbi:MAG: stage III sporulation protein AF [Bacillota bacterium]
MEVLKEMVRSLVALILLGTALDLALPQGSMRGFVRVVVGLLLVQAVLEPAFALVRRPLDPGAAAFSLGGAAPFPGPEEIARRARALRERVQDQALAEMRQRVAAAAAGLARGTPGVGSAAAEVVLGPPGPRGEPPRVLQVRVRVTPAPAPGQSPGEPGGSRSTLAGDRRPAGVPGGSGGQGPAPGGSGVPGPPVDPVAPVAPVDPVAPVEVGPGGSGPAPGGAGAAAGGRAPAGGGSPAGGLAPGQGGPPAAGPVPGQGGSPGPAPGSGPPDRESGPQSLAAAVQAEVARGLGLRPEQVVVLVAGSAPAGSEREDGP